MNVSVANTLAFVSNDVRSALLEARCCYRFSLFDDCGESSLKTQWFFYDSTPSYNGDEDYSKFDY